MRERVHVVKLYLIGFIIATFWVLLTSRLVQIQLVNGKFYSERSIRQSEKKISLRGKRGSILDRNSVSLAVDFSTRSVAVNPKEVERPAKLAVHLSALTGESPNVFLRRLKQKSSFVWLARQLNWDAAKKLDVLRLTGVREIEEPKRVFPLGSVAGQLIGGTDIDNKGIEGVEIAFDKYLRGASGWSMSGVDASGKELSVFGNVRKGPRDGLDVVLTIDSRYQAIAEGELEAAVSRFDAEAGTAIIADPKTGEILAMATFPPYDPNCSDRSNLANRKNRAITDCFEPGSIFKVVAVSAALEEGVKSPTDPIFCENGKMNVGGAIIHDWHNYGWLSLTGVIQHSSNIGAMKIAQAVGAKRLYSYIRAFGFGTKTGIELLGEADGVVHHPSSWSKRSLATIAIGQEVSASTIQLVAAFCAIANGGYLMKPHILKSIAQKDSGMVREQSPEVVRRVISEKTAKTLTRILCAVADSGTGVQAKVEGFSVAGKTGTAQKIRKDGRGYDRGRVICSFVGFLPAEDPQLLCLVSIDEPRNNQWAGQVAAPTFKKIVSRILSLNGCPIKRKPFTLTASAAPVSAGPSSAAPVSASPSFAAITEGQSKTSPAQTDESPPMPKVIGMSLRQAIEVLRQQGIEARIVGTGVVQKQSPQAGEKIGSGAVCLIEAKSGMQ